jgi:hypothetical protein
MKYINALCKQNAGVENITANGTYIYNSDIKGYNYFTEAGYENVNLIEATEDKVK